MRVLVCGGRDFMERAWLYRVLDYIHAKNPISLIIEGEARGADILGREWAISRNVPLAPYPADWDRFGKRAGPIRNQQMLDEGMPDFVVAAPGSTGTRHMVRIAKEAGVPVYEMKRKSKNNDKAIALNLSLARH